MSSSKAASIRERARRDALLISNLEDAKRGDERAFMNVYTLRAEQAAVCASLDLPHHDVGPTLVQAFRDAWHTLPRCDATRAIDFDVWLLGILTVGITARRGGANSTAPGAPIWDMPAALRNVLLLREVFGHGLDEIARALDEPEPSVRLWYRNALEGIAA